jgi:hypothetical protein
VDKRRTEKLLGHLGNQVSKISMAIPMRNPGIGISLDFPHPQVAIESSLEEASRSRPGIALPEASRSRPGIAPLEIPWRHHKGVSLRYPEAIYRSTCIFPMMREANEQAGGKRKASPGC